MSLVQCPYDEEQGYIYISDDYTNNVLKLSGYNDIDSEKEYFNLCEESVLKEHLHIYSLKNLRFAYLYARNILKGRFELGEPTIATDANYSYLYAKNILKGRFELGEPIIRNNIVYKTAYEKFTGVKL
jgi:hypothetical protein